MSTKAERRVKIRYCALIYGPVDDERYRPCAYGGFAADFYPDEVERHRRDYLRQGYKILGTYDNPEIAKAVIWWFLKLVADRYRKLPNKDRISRRQAKLIGDEVLALMALQGRRTREG